MYINDFSPGGSAHDTSLRGNRGGSWSETEESRDEVSALASLLATGHLPKPKPAAHIVRLSVPDCDRCPSSSSSRLLRSPSEGSWPSSLTPRPPLSSPSGSLAPYSCSRQGRSQGGLQVLARYRPRVDDSFHVC